MSSVNYSLKHKGVKLISAEKAWDQGKYAVPFREPRPKKEYKLPDKEYRIHIEDKATVNSLKYRNKKRR